MLTSLFIARDNRDSANHKQHAVIIFLQDYGLRRKIYPAYSPYLRCGSGSISVTNLPISLTYPTLRLQRDEQLCWLVKWRRKWSKMWVIACKFARGILTCTFVVSTTSRDRTVAGYRCSYFHLCLVDHAACRSPRCLLALCFGYWYWPCLFRYYSLILEAEMTRNVWLWEWRENERKVTYLFFAVEDATLDMDCSELCLLARIDIYNTTVTTGMQPGNAAITFFK